MKEQIHAASVVSPMRHPSHHIHLDRHNSSKMERSLVGKTRKNRKKQKKSNMLLVLQVSQEEETVVGGDHENSSSSRSHMTTPPSSSLSSSSSHIFSSSSSLSASVLSVFSEDEEGRMTRSLEEEKEKEKERREREKEEETEEDQGSKGEENDRYVPPSVVVVVQQRSGYTGGYQASPSYSYC
ncbi:hypothetical protein CSUI_005803 [Cystoisospora suis]|uniref:Uncharacterized protein n=1 Tax=Cystoisospora suis TaxID=483139 RepID=A0A2C6KW89_9APIC|nr:hypothetical protein CSUI_005803 [Cystoisospora suis]